MTRSVNHILFFLLLLLVLMAPTPLGSYREWSWTLSAFAVALLCGLWVLNALLASLTHKGGDVTPLNPLLAALFMVAPAWAWMQTATWVPESWKHPLWMLAGDYLGVELPGAIALSADDAFTAIMRLMLYALVFFLALQLGRDRRRARRAMWWILAAGVAYSVYGLLSYWGVLREFMWYQDDAFRRDVRATFVNRNHFATWVGLSLICAIGIFYDHMFRRPANPMMAMQGMAEQIERFLVRAWLPLSAVILLVSALVSTHSRGGFSGTFAGGLVLLFLIDRKRGRVNNRARVVAGAALAVSAISFYISSEILLQRIDQSHIDSEGRTTVYMNVSRGIADNPLLGYGYGSFEDSFRLYRRIEIAKKVDEAHNTYLENIFELGLPAALCLFGALSGLVLTCLRGVARRRRDWVFPATAVASTVLVGVHALMDFSLQLPAVAMLYALIMGVGCAQSVSSSGRRR
jgi:O-antigen ligase